MTEDRLFALNNDPTALFEKLKGPEIFTKTDDDVALKEEFQTA